MLGVALLPRSMLPFGGDALRASFRPSFPAGPEVRSAEENNKAMIGNRPPALIERGRTFFVDFNPTRGREQSGVRPGIVITSAEMSAGGVLTVVPTTTQKLDRIYPYEVLIPAGRGLPETSKVLVNQLRTIDIAERLKEPIGRIDEDLMLQIDRALVIVLFGPERVG